MGETEQEKYGNNLNELLARFDLHLENDTVQDYEHYRGAPSWILAELAPGDARSRGRPARPRARGLPVPRHHDQLAATAPPSSPAPTRPPRPRRRR